jgi:MerR family redox-sensitive transcriptional activator SoxR
VKELSIGQVADETGVAVSAVRYYEQRGLVEAVRRVGGKRRFGSDAVGRISFIRRAQDAGFALEDVKLILDDQSRSWASLVELHLDELRERREQLDVTISMLEQVQECGCRVVSQCPRVPL